MNQTGPATNNSRSDRLVDSGMMQVALAIAVLGYILQQSEGSEQSAAVVLTGSAVVTMILMLVYAYEWALEHMPIFEALRPGPLAQSFLRTLVLFAYISLAGAVPVALVAVVGPNLIALATGLAIVAVPAVSLWILFAVWAHSLDATGKQGEPSVASDDATAT